MARWAVPCSAGRTRRPIAWRLSPAIWAARQALAPYKVKVAADTFGYTAWLANDMGIGQLTEAVAPHLDVLSPMLYPSTFSDGLPLDGGVYRNAVAFPYDIVNKSTQRAFARAKSVNPAIDIRPWIQDFPDYAFDKRTYTPDEMRAQMDGVLDAGGRGWLLWDPAVKYTRAALVSAKPNYPPFGAGYLPVLRYGAGRGETATALRADLDRLLAAGYYPITLRQMVTGARGGSALGNASRVKGVPAGKRPVVLTFDGATADQFHLLPDGAIDPASAVGVLRAFHEAHPADWPLAATFFIAPDGVSEGAATDPVPGAAVFGQGETAQRKLALLVEMGFEVGSAGLAGGNLGKARLTAADAQRELGLSQTLIERWLPGYRVASLALPGSVLPDDSTLLAAGEHAGMRYRYAAVATVLDALAPGPATPGYAPLAIPRIDAANDGLVRWLAIAERPGVSHVSAGE